MHIGIIAEHSDPARGGAERYVAALCERLRVHGHEVTLVARTGPRAMAVRAWPAGARPQAYAETFLPHLRAAGAERIFTTAPVPGCDFYQPHNGLLAVNIPAHLDPLPAGLRHVRRYNPVRLVHFARLRRFEARAVAPPTRVLALSPRIVDDLQRLYPNAQATLLRPGVDLERFQPNGERAPGPPRLLFVAHNFRLKGLHTLLAALEQIPEAELTVVGGDKPVRAPRVTYVGEDVDLPTLYRAADVLVHPTFYDTAALVVLEAMACGTRVVTSLRDGNADLALEGGGAAVIDPRNPATLVRAIQAVLARPPDGAARAVAERFGEKAMLDRVVEALTCDSDS